MYNHINDCNGYERTALWNQNLRGNLRILLLNNGKGGIFHMLLEVFTNPADDQMALQGYYQSMANI